MLRKLVLAGGSIVWLSLGAPLAEAQVARVFVSVNGNDANVCSNIGTPCRTLGGGVTQVDPDGEVIVVDSGSYAGATITKAVKIDVPSGIVAFSGLSIVVNPGAGKIVVLRGLTIKAASVGSGTGIVHQSGTLFVENTVVDGWDYGLLSQSGAERLLVKGSVFRNNGTGGLYVAPGSSAVFAIDQSFAENNATGLYILGGTGRVSNTVITGNGYGGFAGNSGAEVTFQRCEVTGNSFGLTAVNTALLRVSQSTVTRNAATGLLNTGATLASYGNNAVDGNATDTSGPISSITLR
jgi:hypothetical protein